MRARTFVTLLLLAATPFAGGCGKPAPVSPGAAEETPRETPRRAARERQPVPAPVESPPPQRPTDPEAAALLDDVMGADPDARPEAMSRLREHPDGVSVLAWLLENGSPDVRLRAAKSLRRMGGAAALALPSLLRMARVAGGGGEDVRLEVIGLLGEIADDRALPVLIELLADEEPALVQQTVIALEQYGPRAEPALPGLLGLLDKEPSWVADRAVDAIAALGPAAVAAVPELIAQFDAEEGAGSAAVLEALTAIGPAAREAIPAIAREIVRHERNKEETAREHPELHVQWIPISHYAEDALVKMGEAAIPELIEMLGHELRDVRRRAVSALKELGAVTRPALLTALSDDDANRRKHAVEILAQIAPGDTEVFEAVVPLLADPDEWVRIETAGELHRFGDVALPHLIRALTDHRISWAAARSLAQLGPDAAPAVAALERSLTSESLPLRRRAATALGQIGLAAAGAGPALGRALDDEDEDVREAATLALRKIGPDAVPVLLEAMQHGSDRARVGAATALAGAQDGSAAVTDALLAALDTSDAGVRWRAAVALSRTKQHAERVVPALRAGLEFSEEECDLDVGERLATVASAIGGYGAEGAVALPDLLATLRRFKEWSFPRGYVPGWVEREMDIVKAVITKYAATDPDLFVELLSDEDEYMRDTGRDVLVALGAPLIPRLARVARGGELGAQVAAVEALAALAKHEEARAELEALMQMDGDARRLQAAKAYYHVSEDAKTVVPILLDLVRTSSDPELTQNAAAFLGFRIKAQAAFAVKDIRAAHAATAHEDAKRYLGYAIEAIENR